MIDTGLNGKVVLITGANNPYGIGVNAARAFAAQGAAVFLHYFRRSVPLSDSTSQEMGERFYWATQMHSATELVAEIEAIGGRAAAWEADLSNPAVVPQLFDRAEAALGPVEILINNAARSDPDTFVPDSHLEESSRAVDGFPMQSINAEQIVSLFAVNCQAPALLIAEFAKRHVARGASWGRIINVSTDGASAFPTQVSYGASKHALESYSRAAAHELGPYGITVNITSLGPIQTGWISPELAKSIAANTPLRRVGRPDDVADVLVFLASEQAGWLTGQLLYVGGGHAMPL